MKGEFESVLMVYDEKGNTIGFYRNDIGNRAIKMYSCKEMGLEEIKQSMFVTDYGRVTSNEVINKE